MFRTLAVALVAVPLAAFPAGAQDLRRLLLVESREFLDEHLRKLEAHDPAAIDDYAPDAVRIVTTRRGGEGTREARGADLRRQLQRELAEAKARNDQYAYDGFTIALVGSGAQHCAVPTFKPPPPPPPPPAGQPPPPARREAPRVHPERVCWTIASYGTTGYKIREVVVQRPP